MSTKREIILYMCKSLINVIYFLKVQKSHKHIKNKLLKLFCFHCEIKWFLKIPKKFSQVGANWLLHQLKQTSCTVLPD